MSLWMITAQRIDGKNLRGKSDKIHKQIKTEVHI